MCPCVSYYAVAAAAIPILLTNTHPPVCVPTNDEDNLMINEHDPLPSFSLSCTDSDKPSLLIVDLSRQRRKRSGFSTAVQNWLNKRNYRNPSIATVKYGSIQSEVVNRR